MDALFKQKLAEILEALERIPPTEPLSVETVENCQPTQIDV